MSRSGSIVSVLLIPAVGDPQQLLKEGVCGARPPMAWRYDTDHCEECGLLLVGGDCPSPPGSRPPGSDGPLGCWEARGNDNDGVWRPGWMEGRDASEVYALALAWEGDGLDDGVSRCGGLDVTNLCMAIAYALLDIDDGASLIEATEDLGTIILLDENGREVTR